MHDEIEMLVASLARMTVTELRVRYEEVWAEPARTFNKQHLVKRIAWRTQANREGGLSERARRRAAELANDADLRTTIPKVPLRGQPDGRTVVRSFHAAGSGLPAAGSLLRREYRGRMIIVRVLRDGFEYEGGRYRSLTAIAEAVTGTHWNGRHFFGLKSSKEATA